MPPQADAAAKNRCAVLAAVVTCIRSITPERIRAHYGKGSSATGKRVDGRLHAQSWPNVEPVFHEGRRRERGLWQPERHHRAAPIARNLSASVLARVDTLFGGRRGRMGTLIRPAEVVIARKGTRLDDLALVDFAATQTLLNVARSMCCRRRTSLPTSGRGDLPLGAGKVGLWEFWVSTPKPPQGTCAP